MKSKRSSEEIAEMILKSKTIWLKRYCKLNGRPRDDEINRRLAMLTKPFIIECIDLIYQGRRNLKIKISSTVLVSEVLRHIEQMIILVPEIGPTKCELVREYTAAFIVHFAVHLINERLRIIGSIRKFYSLPSKLKIKHDPKFKDLSNYDLVTDDLKEDLKKSDEPFVSS